MGATQDNYVGLGLLPGLITADLDAKEKATIKAAHVANLSGQSGGALPTATQAATLARMPLTKMLDLPGYQIVVHDEPIDRHVMRTLKTRYVPSDSPCYADLVIDDNMYAKDAFSGRNLMTFVRFRVFGQEAAPTRSFGTWVKTKLTAFSMQSADVTEAGSKDVNSAFEKNIVAFAGLNASSGRPVGTK